MWTVLICAFWSRSSRPSIQGGPLASGYDFYSMMFHWGPSDVEGSEHTLDYVRYPMELQMIHVKHGFNSPLDAIVLGAKDGVMIISFFFQVLHTCFFVLLSEWPGFIAIRYLNVCADHQCGKPLPWPHCDQFVAGHSARCKSLHSAISSWMDVPTFWKKLLHLQRLSYSTTL